jgi:hypothetical protein
MPAKPGGISAAKSRMEKYLSLNQENQSGGGIF